MKLKILVLVVMLGIVGRVDAQSGMNFYNTNEILALCEDEQKAYQLMCEMYLAGIMDAKNSISYSIALEASGTSSFWGVCATAGVTVTQLRKIFIKYMNENPGGLHLPASQASHSAFIDAFPCK